MATPPDLATGIANLAVASEKRRVARASLRESTAVVVPAIVKQCRVGDATSISIPGSDTDLVYVVEQVRWETLLEGIGPYIVPASDSLGESHIGRPTLVQYPISCDDMDPFGPGTRLGAVLHDVRSKYFVWPDDEEDPGGEPSAEATPRGSRLWRERRPDDRSPYMGELHLATDSELAEFARHAGEVVQKLAGSIRDAAEEIGSAARTLTKLSPR